jgi:hypothetical protein
VSVVECICCNEDGTNGSEWRDPAVQIDGGMTEDFILDLCARGLVPRVICLPLEEDVLRRFGRRRDPNVDPDEDPKTVLRPDDAPIFDSFRRMYNRLDSWTFFIAGHHPELTAEFDAKFALEVKRGVWLAALKERTVTFKETFRDLRDSDPERARRAYQDAVLGGIEAEITATVREVGDWFKDRTGSTEPIGELLQRVHDAGTELWREAWRAASLQVNRVLARLWPPAKTQILVWVGQERRKHPDVDLSGNVEELDYIGSLATGFKGPPKQHIRFNPRKFDVDANLEAPPLEKYAVAVDRLTPDRKRIFGNDTTIVPLKDFSARTHAELVAQVTGYDAAPPPFDVAIDAAEPPGQTRVRLATERLFALREALSTARYEQLIGEITASGFLDPLGAVRGDLSETDAVRLNAIMDRFDPPGANPPAPARP